MNQGSAQPCDRRAIDEWALYRKGKLRLAECRPWGGAGIVMRYHGDPKRLQQCALTLVTEPGHAVSILALGSHQQVLACHDQWADHHVELSRSTHPPVSILLYGESWTFHGARGRWLLGVAQARSSVVLLGHDGERVRFLCGDGCEFAVYAALGLDELPDTLDLDARVPRDAKVRAPKRSQPAKAKDRGDRRRIHRPAPPEIPEVVRQHYRRILEGVDLDADIKEAAHQVVRLYLEGVARAAATVERPRTRNGGVKARRSVDCVWVILDLHHRMGQDHEGCGRAIYRRFVAYDEAAMRMTADEFVAALGLIVDTGTFIATRPSFQRWHLRGDGIADPHAELHRDICEATRTAASRPRSSTAPLGRSWERAWARGRRGALPVIEVGARSADPAREGEDAASGPEPAGRDQRRADGIGSRDGEASEPTDGGCEVDGVEGDKPSERDRVAGGEGSVAIEGGVQPPPPVISSSTVTSSPAASSSSCPGPSRTAGPLALLVVRSLVVAGLATDDVVTRFREHHWPRPCDRATREGAAGSTIRGGYEVAAPVTARQDLAFATERAPVARRPQLGASATDERTSNLATPSAADRAYGPRGPPRTSTGARPQGHGAHGL